jgi:hypothetical protein
VEPRYLPIGIADGCFIIHDQNANRCSFFVGH